MPVRVTHSTYESAAEEARKRARYEVIDENLGYLYRIVDDERDRYPVMGLIAYPIRSITPKGVTIVFRGNRSGWKFIPKFSGRFSYAHPTVEGAMENYVVRKKRHVALLNRRLQDTKALLHLATNTYFPTKLVPEEEPDSFTIAGTVEDESTDLLPREALKFSLDMGVLP